MFDHRNTVQNENALVESYASIRKHTKLERKINQNNAFVKVHCLRKNLRIQYKT